LERKGVAEGVQVNFFKRCKLINYERLGKRTRINDICQKNKTKRNNNNKKARIKLKPIPKIYLTLRERERERGREREREREGKAI